MKILEHRINRLLEQNLPKSAVKGLEFQYKDPRYYNRDGSVKMGWGERSWETDMKNIEMILLVSNNENIAQKINNELKTKNKLSYSNNYFPFIFLTPIKPYFENNTLAMSGRKYSVENKNNFYVIEDRNVDVFLSERSADLKKRTEEFYSNIFKDIVKLLNSTSNSTQTGGTQAGNMQASSTQTGSIEKGSMQVGDIQVSNTPKTKLKGFIKFKGFDLKVLRDAKNTDIYYKVVKQNEDDDFILLKYNMKTKQKEKIEVPFNEFIENTTENNTWLPIIKKDIKPVILKVKNIDTFYDASNSDMLYQIIDSDDEDIFTIKQINKKTKEEKEFKMTAEEVALHYENSTWIPNNLKIKRKRLNESKFVYKGIKFSVNEYNNENYIIIEYNPSNIEHISVDGKTRGSGTIGTPHDAYNLICSYGIANKSFFEMVKSKVDNNDLYIPKK